MIARQKMLVAQRMLLGFIYGVMNTDNTFISGETIDYCPCAFTEVYDPATAFSLIDHHGRYLCGNQPRIALWNLTQLWKLEYAGIRVCALSGRVHLCSRHRFSTPDNTALRAQG